MRRHAMNLRSKTKPKTTPPRHAYKDDFRYGGMEMEFARGPTTKQDRDRQVDALRQEGMAAQRIYVDTTFGATTNRPGLHPALGQGREGDMIVVHTLDRLGRAGQPRAAPGRGPWTARRGRM